MSADVRSLMWTNSTSPLFHAARNTLRPMRPKLLIPMRTAMETSAWCGSSGCIRRRGGGQNRSGTLRRGVSLLVSNVPFVEGEDAAAAVARRVKIPVDRVRGCLLVRKSLDARHKRPTWKAVYRAEVADEA